MRWGVKKLIRRWERPRLSIFRSTRWPSPTGKYQGFSPDDVIYLLMPIGLLTATARITIRRSSKGLYDRSKTRRYHGGDLEGIISKLPDPKSLGLTAIWTTPIYDNKTELDEKEVMMAKKPRDTIPATVRLKTDMYSVDEHFGDVEENQAAGRQSPRYGPQNGPGSGRQPHRAVSRLANDPPTPSWWNGTADNHLSNNGKNGRR